MDTDKRFHVQGNHIHDRICATCDNEDAAILWSAAATITTLNLYGTLDPLGRLGSTAFVCGAGVRSFTYTGPGGETFTIA